MNNTSAATVRITTPTHEERVTLWAARVAFYVSNGVGYAMARERAHVDVASVLG
mgnify:FL=1